jgi:hypothetical protein
MDWSNESPSKGLTQIDIRIAYQLLSIRNDD